MSVQGPREEEGDMPSTPFEARAGFDLPDDDDPERRLARQDEDWDQWKNEKNWPYQGDF